MNLLDEYSIALLLSLIGLLLVVAEVFFPSGGVLGATAGLSLIAAIYFAYTKGGWTSGLYFAAADTVLVPVLIVLAFQWLPYTPMGKVLLGRAPTAEEVDPADARHEMVGKVGVARSKLLPAGSVEIDGRMLDCVSAGQAIDPGEYVRVIEVRGNRVVVRRAGEGERPSEGKPDDLLARPAEELGIDGLDFDSPEPDSV